MKYLPCIFWLVLGAANVAFGALGGSPLNWMAAGFALCNVGWTAIFALAEKNRNDP